MKIKNLVIGARVQVKAKNHAGFYSSSVGKCGVINDVDDGAFLDVRIKYDDGDSEWGNHKGIRIVPKSTHEIVVGTRVRLKVDHILRFQEGDVGTVKALDGDGAAVYFDVARNGWENTYLGIPDLHGLWVDVDELEVITS